MQHKFLFVVLAGAVVAMTLVSPALAGDSAGGAGSLLVQQYKQ